MNAALAIQLLLAALEQAQRISGLIATAHTAGRDVTAAELDALVETDATARADLQMAIEAARAAGR